MKRRPQRSRQMIPTAGVIEPTMNQDQRRRRRVTPIREVKSKPLGPIIAPVGSVQCCVHGAYLKPSLSQVQRRARATMSMAVRGTISVGMPNAPADPSLHDSIARFSVNCQPDEFPTRTGFLDEFDVDLFVIGSSVCRGTRSTSKTRPAPVARRTALARTRACGWTWRRRCSGSELRVVR